ncbi:MAG: M48 family metalloprotease [Fimbriimonadaceae bacterium]
MSLSVLLALAVMQDPAPQTKAQTEVKHQAELDRDTKLGEKYSKEVEKEVKFSKNEAMIARTQRVANELAAIAYSLPVEVTWGDKRLNPFKYTFKVIEGEDINAFSLPGGFIYVYEGLLKFADTDDELAGVLAHEIAHASLRHVDKMEKDSSKLQLATLPLILIGIFAGGNETAAGAGALGQLVKTAIGSGWSINAERAADYAGMQYMLKSSYNPVGMLTFMERLGRQQRQYDRISLGIFQTHPPSKERAEGAISRLEKFGVPVERSKVSTAYRAVAVQKESGPVELAFSDRLILKYGGQDALKRAKEDAARLNEFLDSVPDMYNVTMSSNGLISGYGKPIMKITEEDAAAAKIPFKDLSEKTFKAVKLSVYLIAYRIWDAR